MYFCILLNTTHKYIVYTINIHFLHKRIAEKKNKKEHICIFAADMF